MKKVPSYALLTAALLATTMLGCSASQEESGNRENVPQSESANAPVDSNVKASLASMQKDRATADNSQSAATTMVSIPEAIQAAIEQLESDLAQLKTNVQSMGSREEQLAFIEQNNPVPGFVDRMINLARKNASSPDAVNAVLAAVARSRGADKHRAMLVLLDEFIADLNLKKMVDSFLKEIPGPQYDEYFQRIIHGAKDDDTTAYALLNYSNYIDQIPAFRNALNDNPQLMEKLPQPQIEYIQNMPDEAQTRRREECLQRLFDDFADLRYRGQQTYGELAKRELYELQHLSVGMVAPDIVGRDLDGVEFRLSDYRGKVVMLDFWGHWCFPCRQMYPEERELVRRLGKAPFALIGINTDSKLETAQSAVAGDNLTWRNFWDGPEGTNGPISRQWNITAWPTVYLIDGDGVIRYKDILGEDIHEAIESLLAEMGQPVALD